MIFAADQKDEWLKFLVLQPVSSQHNTVILADPHLSEKGITIGQLIPLLEYFERMNFIKIYPISGSGRVRYSHNQEAVDFLGRGGFFVQEEHFENNIKKLLLEIDNLKRQLSPDKMETVNTITSIGNNILSGLNMLSSIKF